MASTESSSPSDREAPRPTGGQAFLPVIIRPRKGLLSQGAESLCRDVFVRGGLIAFPTDTVYGVGANAGNWRAVRRLFAAKRRPLDRPLPVLVGDGDDVLRYGRQLPVAAAALAAAFWPGPLTMVVRRARPIRPVVSAGGDTVGLRMPDHPVALRLLRVLPGPLAVTSANLSGEESTISAAEVLRTLGPSLDVLIDVEVPGSGLPSTVIDLTTSPPRVLRQGAVTLEQLESVIGEVVSPLAYRRPA